MKKTSKKGFTLVELMIVIVIIGILAAIIIPSVSNAIGRANRQAELADLQSQLRNWMTNVSDTTAANTADSNFHYYEDRTEVYLNDVRAIEISGEDIYYNSAEFGWILISNNVASVMDPQPTGAHAGLAAGTEYYLMTITGDVITITKTTVTNP